MSIVEAQATEVITAQLAGRGRRLNAFLVDVVFALIAIALAEVFRQARIPFLDVLPDLAFAVFQSWLLAIRGQTVGKILLKIAIVDPELKIPPGFIRASLFRYGVQGVLSQVYPLGFFVFTVVDSLFIFTPSRRCLHDRMARTEVIAVGDDWGNRQREESTHRRMFSV